ncbi:MAG: acyl-CoA dehydrogenase, partial [Duganella sp.]
MAMPAQLSSLPSAAPPRDASRALRRLLLRERGGATVPDQLLRRIVAEGLDRLPLPGRGATLQRWRALAQVAGHDLSLLKLYEGHTDALAILAELGVPAPPNALWGVWCAEPPDARVALRRSVAGAVRLSGRKQWCSGAASVSHALVSCRDADGRPWLAAVALDQPGVTVTADGWQAVGMAGSASVDVIFDDAGASVVGASGAYVDRPGFWHGGAGIAACWYGAARAIGVYLHAAVRADAARQASDPHRLAQLGMVDVALAGAAAALREAAAAIDADPAADACALALRAR